MQCPVLVLGRYRPVFVPFQGSGKSQSTVGEFDACHDPIHCLGWGCFGGLKLVGQVGTLDQYFLGTQFIQGLTQEGQVQGILHAQGFGHRGFGNGLRTGLLSKPPQHLVRGLVDLLTKGEALSGFGHEEWIGEGVGYKRLGGDEAPGRSIRIHRPNPDAKPSIDGKDGPLPTNHG